MSGGQKVRLRPPGVSNRLWNEDLAVVESEERTWGVLDYISLWTAMSVCIPAYMLASGLIAVGMTYREAIATILLGNVIVLAPMLLNAHAGAKYGVPFPVYARASFGVMGAQVPAILQALVACGWFGIQCWIGGEALYRGAKILLPSLGKGWVWWCFGAFWLLNMALVGRGIKAVKRVGKLGAPLMLVVGLALLFWMVERAGGLAMVFENTAACCGPDPQGVPTPFWRIFFPSLTGTVGYWATVAVSVSDFTRNARSQRAHIVGQAIGLPMAMTLYSLIAIAVTAATVMVMPHHQALWNPIELIASFNHPLVAVAGLGAIVLAALNANIASNLVTPARIFSSFRPDVISFRFGELIARLLGLAWMPWRLVGDPGHYINGWLVGTSGVLGPVAGILIMDYFVIRKRSLDVNDLYLRDGIYEYHGGVNRRALLALASGVIVALIGLFVPQLHWLYECAWFVGFGVAAMFYLALMSGPDVRAMIPPTPLLIPVDGFEPEAPLA